MTVAHHYSTLKNEKLHRISHTVQTISTQSYRPSIMFTQRRYLYSLTVTRVMMMMMMMMMNTTLVASRLFCISLI